MYNYDKNNSCTYFNLIALQLIYLYLSEIVKLTLYFISLEKKKINFFFFFFFLKEKNEKKKSI